MNPSPALKFAPFCQGGLQLNHLTHVVREQCNQTFLELLESEHEYA